MHRVRCRSPERRSKASNSDLRDYIVSKDGSRFPKIGLGPLITLHVHEKNPNCTVEIRLFVDKYLKRYRKIPTMLDNLFAPIHIPVTLASPSRFSVRVGNIDAHFLWENIHYVILIILVIAGIILPLPMY